MTGDATTHDGIGPADMTPESWARAKDSLPYWRLRANRLDRENKRLREHADALEECIRIYGDVYTKGAARDLGLIDDEKERHAAT